LSALKNGRLQMIRRIAFSAPHKLDFPNQVQACLDYLESLVPDAPVLGVLFFIQAGSTSEFFVRRNDIRVALDERHDCMPFNVLAQAAEESVALEIWVADLATQLDYLTFGEVRYSRFASSFGSGIWGLGLAAAAEDLQLADQVEYSFEAMSGLLAAEGLNLSDIVRQWNYVPEILTHQKKVGRNLQHYQIFNEIRQEHYSKVIFSDGYPAATGIGVRMGNFSIDFLAVRKNSNVRKTGLSNPKQQNAYEYAESQLMGDAVNGAVKRPPLFERAKMLQTPESTVVFVSGTASIIGQDTIGVGDVRLQTEICIGNMLELIAPKITYRDHPGTFNYLRVYIKNRKDFNIVRSVCALHFPSVSTSYVQADVCRDELLMEIEGEAVV
jgi:enamine deaminase RidA (YjgF/YER057c/UK114 family)